MVIDQTNLLARYENLHPRFPAAFAFLQELIAKGAENGKHVMPNADVENAVYVNLVSYEVEKKEEAVAESHEQYIDVQVVLEGAELMCVPAEEAPAVTTPYNAEGDCTLYAPVALEKCHCLDMQAGSFVIFFNQELHAPSMGLSEKPTKVRKAIIKVLA